MTKVKDLIMIQINTDGITVRIPVSEKRHFYNLCKEWEKETALILEYVAYKKMIIRDVNNYMGLYMDGKVKYKGTFKTYEQTIKDEEMTVRFASVYAGKLLLWFFLLLFSLSYFLFDDNEIKMNLMFGGIYYLGVAILDYYVNKSKYLTEK